MGQVVELRNQVLEMVQELEGLKEAEAEIKARRRAITEELTKVASFKGRTGYVATPGYKVSISVPRTAKWDQAKLRDARKLVGDEQFKLYFSYEFVARDMKVMDMAPEAIREALTYKDGAAQVRITKDE